MFLLQSTAARVGVLCNPYSGTGTNRPANTQPGLYKNGGSVGSASSSATIITSDSNVVLVDLDSSDTNTLGPLVVTVYDNSGNPCGVANFYVLAALPAVAGSAMDATKLNGSATAAANLALVWASVETGTAQGGGASTITLRSGASGTDDKYKNQCVMIVSGTGAGQTNRITGYVGSSKVATVSTAWATEPDSTSVYVVLGRAG